MALLFMTRKHLHFTGEMGLARPAGWESNMVVQITVWIVIETLLSAFMNAVISHDPQNDFAKEEEQILGSHLTKDDTNSDRLPTVACP